MQETDKLKLRKPEYNEYADVADLNHNMNILDEKVDGKLGKTEKAADSEKLDGLDSLMFARSYSFANNDFIPKEIFNNPAHLQSYIGGINYGKEAGLPDLDEAFPYRKIRSSGKISSATRHAEENVVNDFINAIKEVGLEAEDVIGTLKIHQSNPKGVCPTCLSGLGNPAKPSGVIKQLSEMFPKLRIEVTSEVLEGVKVNGRLQFIVENGKYVIN